MMCWTGSTGGVLDGSSSASYEDGSDYTAGDARCAVRVYGRYSWSGGNRVSMNLTLVGRGRELFLSAITSGGSQGMFRRPLQTGCQGQQAVLLQISRRQDIGHHRLSLGQGRFWTPSGRWRTAFEKEGNP